MTTQELKQYIDKVLGNSIRCLLPSYWWKRLFISLADRVDEVEQSTSQLIDSKVEEVKMPIVESVDELSKLDLPKGSVAAVKDLVCSFKDLYRLTEEDFEDVISNIKKTSRIERIAVKPYVRVPEDFSSCMCVLITRNLRSQITFIVESQGDTLQVRYFETTNIEAEWIKLHNADGSINKEAEEQLNSILKEREYQFVGNPNGPTSDEEYEVLDSLFTIWGASDLYIKGCSWERLAKESDLVGNEGGSEDVDYFVVGYDAYRNVYQTADDIAHNKEVYAKYAPWGSKPFKLALQFYRKDRNGNIVYNESQNPSYIAFSNFYNGLTYYGVRVESPYFSPDNIDIVFSSDGTAAIYSHTEPRDINIVYASHDGSALDEGYKKANKAIYDRIYNGRYTSIPVSVVMYYELGCSVISTTCSKSGEKIQLQGMDLEFYVLELDSSGNVTVVTNTPLSEMFGPSITIDSELSDTSENAVQNKAVTEALNKKASVTYVDERLADVEQGVLAYVDASSANVKAYTDTEVAKKVDKVSGKQLSTEDFTTALKTKLEGLNAFDPTEINNKVDGLQTQLNTLVSGDASTAIESFNEITAFLNGVEDSESLDSIIAAIEQQIANKQDKLVSGTNIKTINGESILGEGNIVVNVDTSNLATKQELNAKQDVISDLETIRSGAALGATALQEHQDISHLATKEEVTNLQNEVIANEEVTAAALNDLNSRIKEIITRLNNAGL